MLTLEGCGATWQDNSRLMTLLFGAKQVPQRGRGSCLREVPGVPRQAIDLLQQYPESNGRVQWGPRHHWKQDQGVSDQLRGSGELNKALNQQQWALLVTWMMIKLLVIFLPALLPDQRPVCHHLQLPKQKDLQGETRVLSAAQKTHCVSTSIGSFFSLSSFSQFTRNVSGLLQLFDFINAASWLW